MQEINSETSLRDAILQLERKRAYEGAVLKEEFRITLAGLKPSNLVKSTIMDLVTSRDSGSSIMTSVAGLTAGYLGKLIVRSVTKSPFKRILGNAAMFGITTYIARNPETVKSLGKAFFKMIRSKPHSRVISI